MMIALTNYFLTRMNWDEASLKTTGSLEGYWENENYDASHFTLQNIANGSPKPENPNIEKRRTEAEKIVKSGKKYLRYYVVTKINNGLAMSPQPLPKNVPLKLTFVRANAKKSLLSILPSKNVDESFDSRVLDIVNPTLHASFIQSDHYDRKYANHRISRVTFPFLDFKIHRELLTNGVDQFKIKIAEGKFN